MLEDLTKKFVFSVALGVGGRGAQIYGNWVKHKILY